MVTFPIPESLPVSRVRDSFRDDGTPNGSAYEKRAAEFLDEVLWFAETIADRKPRLGLKAAIASGDRGSNSANLQTLNPLFPRGNYFTEAAVLGPQNFFDVHRCLRLQPAPKWSFETGVDFYWREKLKVLSRYFRYADRSNKVFRAMN